jgi:hypothetical protein
VFQVNQLFYSLTNKVKLFKSFRDQIQLDMLKAILQPTSVAYSKTTSKNATNDSGIKRDLNLILQKRETAPKMIPMQDFFNMLQELIHGMSSFN